MAIKKLVESGGKSMSAAMLSVGFSPAYAKNPQKFLKTKTAQELLDEYLPDEMVAMRHSELLNAGEIQHYIFPKLSDEMAKDKKRKGVKIKKNELTNKEIKEIVESVPGCRLIYVKRDFMGAWAFFSAPDGRIRKDAIDMAYKRKGDYAPDKIQVSRGKYSELTNAELAALEKKLIEGIKNRR